MRCPEHDRFAHIREKNEREDAMGVTRRRRRPGVPVVGLVHEPPAPATRRPR
jgi:hypothetical protein